MSLIRRIRTLRTFSFAVGVALGLVSTGYAHSGIDNHLPAHWPGPRVALDQWAIVAGHRQQPTAAEIDRRIDERGTAPSAPRFRDEDRKVQQLYGEIMRQTDPALRP